MDLTRFIENRFQELRLQESKIEANNPEQFPVFINSNIKAHHWVLTQYRKFLQCMFVPNVLFSFWMMKLGLRKEPTAILLKMAREQKAAEEEKKQKDLEKTAKKVGMLQSVQLPEANEPA